MLTLDKIYHAKFVLKQVARKTDLIAATRLCPGTDLYLKTENLQVTGSFNVRRASLPARRATMRRAWRWPRPVWASKALSVCRTVPLL